jgi:lysophospholipase L1-like esterase
MPGFLKLMMAAALLAGFAACSSGTDEGTRGAGREPGSGPARPETTAPERAAAAGGEAAAPRGAPAGFDYVALGDSLAAGVGAERGYVDRYAEHLRNDTGAEVRVVNLGVSGQTAPQLLEALRNDPSTRRAIRGAEVVTFNIGINDLGEAGMAYENCACGGPDDEECLRAAVEAVKRNWDAVTEEILRLRSTDAAVIRTTGLGYTPDVDGVYGPYLAEVNRHIAVSADDSGIPYAETPLGREGMSQDGVHPNDGGYEKIADGLRGLGYDPLVSR